MVSFLHHLPPSLRGSFVLLVVVFSGVFLTILTALTGYIFVQKEFQLAKENREKAFHIAEAGLEYYRWFLARHPGDLTNGTGLPGPYTHTVYDPEGGAVGTFSLEISGSLFCGQVTDIHITSVGWTNDAPHLKRSVSARYARPSVATYSHIVDANVWAGADRVITGPYHSNQGVRMDGTHNARVSSGVSEWLCTSSFGCSGTQVVPGVFGSGSQSTLWMFPTTPINFGLVSVDLATLKTYAQSDGVYLPPSGDFGYQIRFLSDGRIEARRVRTTTAVWEYTIEEGWQEERRVIRNTRAPVFYTPPPDCPVIFVEDNVWIEGEVSGKLIFAAATIPDTGVRRSVVLNGSLTYAGDDDGITIIGQEDVLIGLTTPNTMNINGIFIAQNGRFGRNHYSTAYLPNSLDPFVTRATLTTNGTVVSKERVGTQWSCGGLFCSGYSERVDSYDARLADAPPPFTPFTSDIFRFDLWREDSL